MKNIGRNDSCNCGSGKKFKKCCLPKQEQITPANTSEKKFIAELHPEIDEQIDDILARMESGDQSGAREIETLFKKYPDYHTTNYAMGVVLAHFQKKHVQATPLFERAVEIFPYFGSAYFNLGSCYLKAVEIEKAIGAFRAAKKYAEDDDIAYRASDQLSSIENIVRTKSLPTLDAYIQNAQIFSQGFEALTDRRYEDAVTLLQMVLKKEPNCVQAFGNMALAYASLGKKFLAMECIDKALALDPLYEPAMVNRIAISKMTEGEPLAPRNIHETRYYAEHRGENKSSYFHDFLESNM